MSLTPHTPEPWHHDDHNAGKPVVLWDESGKYVGHIEAVGDAAKTKANAARVVTCINACGPKGIVTRALRTALSNFSGADDSEIREALKILGAQP